MDTILAAENPILAQMGRFSAAYGKNLSVDSLRWRYYRLGDGPAVVWLTGGLRRAAFGFGFLQLLAHGFTVLAPDYPVLRSFEEFDQGLCAILHRERIRRFHLAGQSYGGVLAQPFLACHPQAVDRLVLSSTGPADYGRAWLPVEYLAIGLARLLPERPVKRLNSSLRSAGSLAVRALNQNTDLPSRRAGDCPAPQPLDLGISHQLAGMFGGLAPEFSEFPAWANGVDLMFADAAGWRRPIRFRGGVGGHAAVLDTAERARQSGGAAPRTSSHWTSHDSRVRGR